MAVGGIGQGALANQIEYIEQIRQQQMAGPVKKAQPGAPANIDRVEVSPLSTQSISATPPQGKPQMYQLFTEEIEAGIGRIENILKNARFATVTGSMREHQRPGIINEPEKGNLAKDEARVAGEKQEYVARKMQEMSDKSFMGQKHTTLNAIIDTVKNEQMNRNSQVQAATNLLH